MSPNLLNILNDEEKEEIFFFSPFPTSFPRLKRMERNEKTFGKGKRAADDDDDVFFRRIQRDLCTVITNQTTARKTRSPFGCSETLIPICVYQVGAHEIFLLDKRFLSKRSRVVYG